MHISNLKIYKNPYTINDDGFISFKDRKSYERYLSKYLKDPIVRGAQGTAYLTTDEGIIYKKLDLTYDAMYSFKCYSEARHIITVDDFDLDCFAFPIDLYSISNSQYLGYTSKYFKGDKLKNNNESDYIDFSNLRDAYYRFMEDVNVLSKYDIFLYDLVQNLLYNEEQFMAIDTTNYGLKEDDYRLLKNHDDYFMANRILVEDAIGEEISTYTGDSAYDKCKDIDEIISCIKSKNNGSMIVHKKRPIVKK